MDTRGGATLVGCWVGASVARCPKTHYEHLLSSPVFTPRLAKASLPALSGSPCPPVRSLYARGREVGQSVIFQFELQEAAALLGGALRGWLPHGPPASSYNLLQGK